MTDPDQNGFTLVELLVALVIFGIIMVLSFDALRFGGAAWDNVSSEAIAIDEETSVLKFLRERLESTSQPNKSEPNSRESVQWWFEGDANKVQFVAPWYRGAAPAGLYKFELWREDRGGVGTLNLSWEPHRLGGSSDLRGDLSGARVLAQGIAQLSLRYYGADRRSPRPKWQSSWSDTTTPPSLLEIVITSERTGAEWTRFVVRTGR